MRDESIDWISLLFINLRVTDYFFWRSKLVMVYGTITIYSIYPILQLNGAGYFEHYRAGEE